MSVVVTQSGDGQQNRTETAANAGAMDAALRAEIGPAVLPTNNEQTAPIVPRVEDADEAEVEAPDAAPADEEDDAEESPAEAEEAPAEDAGPKKKSGAQRNRERIARLEQDVAEARAAVQRMASAPPAPYVAPADAGPPQLDAFATYEDYDDARVTYRARAVLAEMQAEQAQTAAQQYAMQQQATLQAGFQAKLADAQAVYPDWTETVGATELRVHPVIADELQRIEHGPDVMRWLALHPGENVRLHQLPTADDARRALNRLDGEKPWQADRPAAARPIPARTVSHAPAPVAPGVPSATPDVTALDIARLPPAGTGDSFAQYKRWAAKQQGGSR